MMDFNGFRRTKFSAIAVKFIMINTDRITQVLLYFDIILPEVTTELGGMSEI